jgi:hypothetical protein
MSRQQMLMKLSRVTTSSPAGAHTGGNTSILQMLTRCRQKQLPRKPKVLVGVADGKS